MENNVTTHQNNSVHGDDSLLTVKVDNDTFIDAVMDGVTDHGGAEASNAVKERIQSDKPTTTEEIEKNDYVLTPGRYVGFADEEDDGVPFEEKFNSLTNQLKSIFSESKELNSKIEDNLNKLFK